MALLLKESRFDFKMKRVGFGTVIFESAFPFLPDFIKSINEQSHKNFSLLVVAEGVADEKKQEICDSCERPVYFKDVAIGQPIFKNRVNLIEMAKEYELDLLVLGDCDDLFSENRVSAMVEVFDEDIAFFFNKLVDFEMIDIFPKLDSVATRESILEKNYLGMSNTALNIKKLSDGFVQSLNAGNTNVFDWYLFARILEEKEIGKLVEHAFTKYRIYSENIAGLPDQAIEKEYQVKNKHYILMSKVNSEYEKYAQALERRHLNPDAGKFWWDALRVPCREFNPGR